MALFSDVSTFSTLATVGSISLAIGMRELNPQTPFDPTTAVAPAKVSLWFLVKMGGFFGALTPYAVLEGWIKSSPFTNGLFLP